MGCACAASHQRNVRLSMKYYCAYIKAGAWLLFMFYLVFFFFFFFLVSRPGFIRRSFVYYSFFPPTMKNSLHCYDFYIWHEQSVFCNSDIVWLIFTHCLTLSWYAFVCSLFPHSSVTAHKSAIQFLQAHNQAFIILQVLVSKIFIACNRTCFFSVKLQTSYSANNR